MATSIKPSTRILLKNGYIVDGTGRPGIKGSVLLKGRVIEKVFPGEAKVSCRTIDCTDARPDGIEAVFINGQQVLGAKGADEKAVYGMII